MNWSSPNKVIIQGITESAAAFYIEQMQANGADIVAGVSPGQGGKVIGDIPIFDLVEQVLTVTDTIDTTLVFVPPYLVLDAVKEAIATGIKRAIIFTANVPPLDTIELIRYAQIHNTLILGPNSDGIIIPKRVCLGRLQPSFYQSGKVGLISTSKYLSYEVATELSRADMGNSIAISLGNDRIIGSSVSQWLSILEQDPETEAVVFVGQRIKETEDIASFYKTQGGSKPMVSYIAGLKAPKKPVLNDAISIISNHLLTSIPTSNQERRIINSLKKAGVKLAKKPREIPGLLSEMLSNQSN
ncbi:MAG: CoA-binding protein [Cyanobacteria bacterium P01_G01_bin.19]